MGLRHVLQAGALAFLGSASSLAAGVLYDCAVEQTSGPRGWISPRVAIVVDDVGAAQIVDALTLHFETGPRAAKVRKRGDDLRLNWSFTALATNSQQMIPNFQFTATLNTQSGAFKMRGKPVRFPQSVSGSGKCAQRDNLSVKQLKRLLEGVAG